MNIHSFNDLRNNNNNNEGNNNSNNQNDQLFLAGMGENSEQNNFFDLLFPKQVYKIKTASFGLICILTIVYIIQLILYYSIYEPNGYNWGCLLYNDAIEPQFEDRILDQAYRKIRGGDGPAINPFG